MDIYFRNRKLEKQLTDPKMLLRTFGQLAVKVKLRLDNLSNASDLAVLRTIPAAGCHELGGDRKGELAVNVSGNYRLIFEPRHNPIPRKDDGGLNWDAVTAIQINAIEDYH